MGIEHAAYIPRSVSIPTQTHAPPESLPAFSSVGVLSIAPFPPSPASVASKFHLTARHPACFSLVCGALITESVPEIPAFSMEVHWPGVRWVVAVHAEHFGHEAGAGRRRPRA